MPTFNLIVIYIHPRCPHCHELLKHKDEIHTILSKYAKTVKFIEVDDLFFAFDLRSTPTLVADGILIEGVTIDDIRNFEIYVEGRKGEI